MVQTTQHIENDGDILRNEHDQPLDADFFLSQQPAGEKFRIAPVIISAKEKREDESYGHKRPGLPEMNGAGDKQTNGQNNLADQTEANQARQKTFGFGVFQWLKSAMPAMPCQLLQVFGSVRLGGGFWRPASF